MSGLQLINENRFSLMPKNFDECIKASEMFAKSGMVPKLYENQPNKIIVAWELGSSLGLGLMQSLQGIAVINGMPTIWGDSALAIIRSSGLLEQITEIIEGKIGDGTAIAKCVIKRKGMAASTFEFSYSEAKVAGLIGKAGPWSQYPKRMLQLRARGFALRDNFADVLKGFRITEEVQDIGDLSPKYPNAVEMPPENKPAKFVPTPIVEEVKQEPITEPTLDISNAVQDVQDYELEDIMAEVSGDKKQPW